MTRSFLALLIPLLLWHGAATAADAPANGVPALGGTSGRIGIFSEVRLGLAAHDPWSPERGAADIQGLVLFAKPVKLDGGLDPLLPRFQIGGALSTTGKTSHIHAGFNWTFDVTRQVFVEASLGGALHDGKTARPAPADRNAMGCAGAFRESVGVGYRLDGNWSVVASLEHLSNAGLCKSNRGLTNLGIGVGYRF